MIDRSLVTAILLALACFLGTFGVGSLTAAPASAATVSHASSSHTRLWWDGQTCRQFTAFESRPTAERFRHLVADAKRADGYLDGDVTLWGHDRARHASRTVLGLDRGYVVLDCAGSYGL